MPSPEKLSDIKGILSEPLLPQQGPPSSTGSEPRRSTRPKVARPASFPFSQAELLSDARVEVEGGEGEKDLMETLRNAYERLEFTNLSDYTSTGLQLQVEKFQRVRQVELTVPAAGPSWKQAAVTIATTLIEISTTARRCRHDAMPVDLIDQSLGLPAMVSAIDSRLQCNTTSDNPCRVECLTYASGRYFIRCFAHARRGFLMPMISTPCVQLGRFLRGA